MSDNNWFSLHHHSRYSVLDGRSKVVRHVARAKALGYPALALTDHGTMAGTTELTIECKKVGIKPMPGIEAYASYGPKQRKTFHVGLVAVTSQGYLNLVAINNVMARDFYFKPLLDLTRIDELDTEGVILTTGCYFGLALSGNRADPEVPYNIITTLAQHFDVYIEAQVHGIQDEEHDDIEDQYTVLQWSKDLGLPLVLGQDCHYVNKSERHHHDVMKRLGSWSDDPDSATFPGDYGYHMFSAAEAKRMFEPAVWKAGMEGMGRVLAMGEVTIPPLEKFDPIIVRRGDEEKQFRILYDDKVVRCNKDYRNRLTDELEVISQFGFGGYLLLVRDIIEYLRLKGIRYNIRGSASGSLACHLLGITSLDPLEWHLGFDRFLSRNRAKLPDIDIDVDSSRRDEVLAWLREQYRVTAICNYAELGVSEQFDGQFKGSAIQKWKTAQRKQDLTMVPDEYVQQELALMCGDGAVIASRGRHASGLIVAPDDESMKWMPLGIIGSQKNGDDRVVTAMDMASVEAMGYVKVDILGLKALYALDLAVAMSGVDIDAIPLDDQEVYGMLSAGMTIGVFQLEGWSARKGMTRMQPDCIEDIIAAMALFRPAVQDSGATDRYLHHRRRQRDGKKSTRPSLHPDIEAVLDFTYGEVIYQEQVVDILKALGFDDIELGDVLKAVKASNNNVAAAGELMADATKRMNELANKAGWSNKDMQLLETAMEAYANYGFNRAHATSYGLMAYRTAWLAYHHPGPFWQGMITAHGDDDEKVSDYTTALAQRRFTRMPVDVNTSGVKVVVDVERKRIYPALVTIKGIGEAMAKTLVMNAPYESYGQMAQKLHGTRVSGIKELGEGIPPEECSGVIGLLAKAGALRSMT
jgi:DNA polymerase III subunit alpha